MSILLNIKFRQFCDKKCHLVDLEGDKLNHEMLMHHAFYAGAAAQREIYDDNAQCEAVTAQAAAAEAAAPAYASYLICGIAIGAIMTICVALLVLQPN